MPGGTSIPFEYSEQDVNDCVLHLLETESSFSSSSSTTSPCSKLYVDFLRHYHPQQLQQEPPHHPAMNDPDSLTSPGYHHFTNTVKWIHEYNSKQQQQQQQQEEGHHHRLRLNQFADQPHAYQTTTTTKTSLQHQQPSWQLKVEELWNGLEEEEEGDDGDDHDHDDARVEQDGENEPLVRRNRNRHLIVEDDKESIHVSLLDSLSSILTVAGQQKSIQNEELEPASSSSEAAANAQGQTSHRALRKNYKQKNGSGRSNSNNSYYKSATDSYSKSSTLQEGSAKPSTSSMARVYMPTRENPPAFSSPQVPTNIHGTQVELHAGMPKSMDNGGSSSSSSSFAKDTTTSSSNKSPGSWIGGFFHAQPPSSSSKQGKTDLTWNDMKGKVPSSSVSSASAFNVPLPSQHDFSVSLNWATTENPDGVALVHPVFDQGTCGSCWAFAATGSVETSAARNAARDYFLQGLRNMQQPPQHEPGKDRLSALQDLIIQTQIVQAETFQRLNLSIQELLDCDVAADQGCVGGNPLLAFYYIHRYGLVPWSEYPYVGYGSHHYSSSNNDNNIVESSQQQQQQLQKQQGGRHSSIPVVNPFYAASPPLPNNTAAPTCQLDKIVNPVATVQSWGLLHRNHENLIEMALKYIGPVAVGMNGADPAFVNYGGGIFDSPSCEQGANHALLIVGYGQEEVENIRGELKTVRYWIARNSWGGGWGENGFVRIKRGPGGKHIPGVCGIARSPSVALGGQLRPNRYEPLMDNAYAATNMDPTLYHGQNADYLEPSGHDFGVVEYPYCDSILAQGSTLYNECKQIATFYNAHPAVFIIAVAMVAALAAVIPLTYAVVRRRRTARRYDPNSLNLDHDPSRSIGRSSSAPTETTHLLSLKEVYASTHREDHAMPKGRPIIMKTIKQDPFRLSDKLWDSADLAVAAAEIAIAKEEESRQLAATAAQVADLEAKSFEEE